MTEPKGNIKGALLNQYGFEAGFCGGRIDRCDAVRGDPARLAALFADPRAQEILLDGLDPLLADDRLARAPLGPGAGPDTHIFLGCEEGEDGAPLFVPLGHDLVHGGRFAPRVWEAASVLDPAELSLFGMVRSLVDWHGRHGFCANCGGRTGLARGGWARTCAGCGAEHFPRVDPVVIMLAEHGDRVLVGRQERFPPGRYSALAGFVEPGETVEGAVARELFEEAGVQVRDLRRDIRYVASQPWPFPSSLMIACIAQVESDVLCIDAREIEHAFWVDRDGVKRALEGAPDAPFAAPPRMAIAHYLFRFWLDQER